MLIAHGPLALLATKVSFAKEIKNLKPDRKVIIFLLAFVFGILPDFDFFILIALSKPYFIHHEILTHTPIFWILIYLLLRFLYPLLIGRKDKFIDLILKVFLLSTLSHMVTDMLTGYIAFFYPLYNKGLTLFANILPTNPFAGYERHPVFILELFISTIAAVWIFFQLRNNGEKAPYKFITLLFSLVFLFVSFMYFQTYPNQRVQLGEHGMPVFDTDRDMVADALDYDVGNTGSNNILSADTQELLESIEKVKSSRSITVEYGKGGIKADIYRPFGALDSSRYILLSYLQINKPIIPVLKLQDLESEKTDEQLREYLKSENLLTAIDIDQIIKPAPGKILFVIGEKDEIVNLGITDQDGNILIVLDNTKIRTFSIDEVVKQYQDMAVSIEYQN